MNILKILNAGISFAAELVMLALFAFGGYNFVTTPLFASWIFAITLPLIAVVAWGYFNAPKSVHRLKQPWLCCMQIALFTLAAVVAYGHVSQIMLIIFIVFAYASSLFALITKD